MKISNSVSADRRKAIWRNQRNSRNGAGEMAMAAKMAWRRGGVMAATKKYQSAMENISGMQWNGGES
jgi:hypothetical protein